MPILTLLFTCLSLWLTGFPVSLRHIFNNHGRCLSLLSHTCTGIPWCMQFNNTFHAWLVPAQENFPFARYFANPVYNINTSTWLLNVGGGQLQVRSLLLFFCQLCMTCLAKQVIPALLKCPDALLSLACLCWIAQMHFHLQHQSCLDCGDCAKRGWIFPSIKHQTWWKVNWLLSVTMWDGSGCGHTAVISEI